MTLPSSIKKFAAVFSRLPSIGPRQALRLAFYLAESERAMLKDIREAAEELAAIKICPQCFFVYDGEGAICGICSNPSRAKDVVAVVEKATDLISLERTDGVKGRYFIIGDLKKTGVLEPEQKKRLAALKEYISRECAGQAEEIILAINPTAYGDLNAAMLKTELEPMTKKITRLGRGIPTGGEIEFADEETLKSALAGRQ